MPKAGEPVMRQVGRVIYQTCRLTLALPKNAHPRLTFALPNLICLLSCATAFSRGGFNVQASKKTTAAWIAVVSRDASISVSMARAIESRLFVKGFASTDLLETAVCNSVINQPRWTMLTPEEWAQIDHHVTTCDLPETQATWLDLGRQAGFSKARELFQDPTGFYRVFRYDR